MVLILSPFDTGTLISLCLIVVFRIVIMLSLPLFSLTSCLFASSPFGRPRRSLRTSMIVSFTAVLFSMNGRMVLFMRSLTVEGYVRWVGAG